MIKKIHLLVYPAYYGETNKGKIQLWEDTIKKEIIKDPNCMLMVILDRTSKPDFDIKSKEEDEFIEFAKQYFQQNNAEERLAFINYEVESGNPFELEKNMVKTLQGKISSKIEIRAYGQHAFFCTGTLMEKLMSAIKIIDSKIKIDAKELPIKSVKFTRNSITIAKFILHNNPHLFEKSGMSHIERERAKLYPSIITTNLLDRIFKEGLPIHLFPIRLLAKAAKVSKNTKEYLELASRISEHLVFVANDYKTDRSHERIRMRLIDPLYKSIARCKSASEFREAHDKFTTAVLKRKRNLRKQLK